MGLGGSFMINPFTGPSCVVLLGVHGGWVPYLPCQRGQRPSGLLPCQLGRTQPMGSAISLNGVKYCKWVNWYDIWDSTCCYHYSSFSIILVEFDEFNKKKFQKLTDLTRD